MTVAKRHEAHLVLAGRGRRMAAVYAAMSPEAVKGAGVTISMRGGSLFLHFEADTVPALRALVNSYLRWLSMIEKALDIMENVSG